MGVRPGVSRARRFLFLKERLYDVLNTEMELAVENVKYRYRSKVAGDHGSDIVRGQCPFGQIAIG